MRLTDRVLSLHPAVITILFVVLFVGGGVAVNIYPLGSAAWSFIFSAAMFLLAAVGLCTFLVLFPLLMSSAPGDARYRAVAAAVPISMLVGNLSYFASVWAAANALTRFDDRQKSAEFHKTLGTFILELYLPIGIWVIYPRVKRLLAAPVSG